MKHRASAWALAAVVLATLLGLFPEALFLDQNFVERDLAVYYRATKSLLVHLTSASGGLPLWNPYFASGQPYAANPGHNVFHPVTWLFAVLPFAWAFRLQVILPLLAAAGSMWFLLRTLGRSRPASGMGALVWGFGGYTLSTTNGLPILFGISVLPAVLGFVIRTATSGRRQDLAGLGLAFGLLCLAGEPVTLLATPILLVAALAQVATRTGARPIGLGRRLVRVGLGLLLGVAMGSAVLAPAVRLASRSVRAEGIPPGQADLWSFPAIRLVEALAPPALGETGTGGSGYPGSALYPHLGRPFLLSIYPGLLASLLAGAAVMAAVRRRRWRAVLPWASAAALGLLLAAGHHFPLWPLVRGLPLFSGIRYPEKFILVTCLGVTVLAARGFDWLRCRHPRRTMLAALAMVAAIALGVELTLAARGGLLVMLAAAVYALALQRLSQWGWHGGSRVLWLAVALDLVLAGRRLVPTRPEAYLSAPPPVVRKILDSPPLRPVFHGAAWRQPDLDYESVVPPLPAFWRVPTVFQADYDLSELRWSARATQRFLTTLREDPALAVGLLRRRGAGAVIRGDRRAPELLFLPQPRPFAFCAPRLERYQGAGDWAQAVRRLGAEAVEAVLVDAAEAVDVPAEPSPGVVSLLERTPVRIVLDVDAAGPGPSLLALNQTWDEFWVARLDGRPVRLLLSELSLSSVLVPAGRHRIDLTYNDPWVSRGLIVSGLALVALLGLVGWRGR